MEKTITSLLKIADDELEIAKMLYKKKKYAKSLFLFQQAVEKSYKACGLLTRQITIKDLRKVSHDHVLLIKTSVGTLSQDSKRVLNEIPGQEENIPFAEFNSLKNEDFINQTEEDIKKWIKDIETQKKKITETFKDPLVWRKFIEVAVLSGRMTDEEIQNTDLNYFESLSEREMEEWISFFNQMIILGNIGFLTSPHSSNTRYPKLDKEGNFIECPTAVYNQQLPLVKHQKKLMLIVHEAISSINKSIPST